MRSAQQTEQSRAYFSRFLASRRSVKTAEVYRRCIGYAVGSEPDRWLEDARKDKAKAEENLIDFILSSKDKIASSTLYSYIAATKSYTEFYEVPLAWRRIKSVLPSVKRVARDRPPQLEEIRRMLSFADLRSRTAILMFLSLGGRVGAFYFPLSQGGPARQAEFPLSRRKGFGYMRVGDVEFRESGIAKVRVYTGEVEEYETFASTEAVRTLEEYLAARKRAGEKVGPTSPVIRDVWDYESTGRNIVKLRPEIAHPVTEKGIAQMVYRCWKRAGIDSFSRSGGFKNCHGFRKYFETEAKRTVGTQIQWDGPDDRIASEDVELLMGHLKSYHKPPVARLEQVYAKLMSRLLIGESFQLKQEIETNEKSHAQEYTQVRLALLEKEETLEKMQGIINDLSKRTVDLTAQAAAFTEAFAMMREGKVQVASPDWENQMRRRSREAVEQLPQGVLAAAAKAESQSSIEGRKSSMITAG